MNQRWILHADMDAFYASVEQRDHPEFRGKPIIVGGTGRRGVVSAASYEARKFGVRSAMPTFRARELCPQGVFLPGRMDRYGEVSAQIQSIFQEFTPLIEPISLDEAFLDITGSIELFGGPLELGRKLKEHVREATQLIVSVGIAPNKLVAKIACSLGKPDGLRLVRPDEVTGLLAPLPVRWLWGVGPVLAKQLQSIGILTMGALAAIDTAKLREVVGAHAEELQSLARGDDVRHVEHHAVPKSFGEECTFERDVAWRDTIAATLAVHADTVAARLRSDGWKGRTITLKVKLAGRVGGRTSRIRGQDDEPRYPLLTRSRTFMAATDDGTVIRDAALALWDAAKIRQPIRLIGVSVSNLDRGTHVQLDLFQSPRGIQRDGLGRTLDAIVARFGVDAVRRAIDNPGNAAPTMRRKHGT